MKTNYFHLSYVAFPAILALIVTGVHYVLKFQVYSH